MDRSNTTGHAPARLRGVARALAGLTALGIAAATAQPLGVPEDLPGKPGHKRPRWEAGIAGVAASVPDYPASDEHQRVVLPAPYFVYRGRTLRADDEGSRLRRRLTPNLEIDVSGGGAMSSDSSGSDARRGMPDLDYLLELGPNLRMSFEGPTPTSTFIVNMPLRGVASLGDGGLQWRGLVFAPDLALQSERFLGGRMNLRGSIRADFASAQLQRYFYEVSPQYATPERPAFSAGGGYLGSSVGGRIAYAFTPRLRGFLSLRWYYHGGAANDRSPLFRSDEGYSAALGFSWSLFQSKQLAED